LFNAGIKCIHVDMDYLADESGIPVHHRPLIIQRDPQCFAVTLTDYCFW
jgi:hypothetical protein